MKQTLLAATLAASAVAAPVQANYETVGDVGQFAVPLAALAVSFYKDDTEGMKQMLKGWVITQGITHTTKRITNVRRPNKSNCQSFPSGHTASAFSGAAYLHHRYGMKYGLPAYIAASVVGHSRVHANKHWATDVVGGAALAYGVSYLVTSAYDDPNLAIMPANFGNGGVGVAFSYTL